MDNGIENQPEICQLCPNECTGWTRLCYSCDRIITSEYNHIRYEYALFELRQKRRKFHGIGWVLSDVKQNAYKKS